MARLFQLNLAHIVAVVVSLATMSGTSIGQQCTPSWESGLFTTPNIVGPVRSLVQFDAPNGPNLYMGYDTGQKLIRWNGTQFVNMPLLNGSVLSLVVFDDGNGSKLYAGGQFTTAPGVPMSHIGVWNGTTWAAVGSGLNGDVNALTIFDDGSGPALYAGGAFSQAQFQGIHYIARWNGTTWMPLQRNIGVFNDLNGPVYSLAVFNDESGPALYAGGAFTQASGASIARIAKWSGQQWSALGSGATATVRALATFNDGATISLYAGGDFTTIGGVFALRIAKWNGSQWTALTSGANDSVFALTPFDDGQGSRLFVGGAFTIAGGSPIARIARWDGAAWSPAGSGVAAGSGDPDVVYALGAFNGSLFAGGDFALAVDNAIPTQDIARWDGSQWVSLGQGVFGNSLEDAIVFNDGSGPALFVAGDYYNAGGISCNGIGKWDGANWSRVGNINNEQFFGLTVYDDRSGPALYLAGTAGVHKLQAGNWVNIGFGSQEVRKMAVYNTQLYVGGYFTQVAGLPINSIAKWNGNQWSDVGGGTNAHVLCFTTFDDGTGTALYVGGGFTIAGTTVVNRIAKWNGMQWSALGGGVSGSSDPLVFSMCVYDDGTGNALYAAGSFTQAGTIPANHIARWNGTAWSTLDGGTDGPVYSCRGLNSPYGQSLYVGGIFQHAGGQVAGNIARWINCGWNAFAPGLNQDVRFLVDFDDGLGPFLYAGGSFTAAGNIETLRIAKFDHCPVSAIPGDVNADGVVNVDDLLLIINQWGPCPGCAADVTTNCVVDVDDLLWVINHWS